MDITKAFIKAKQPCADGFRWYVRNARQDSSYQELLDALVAAGRVQDACWLLDQFGPTDAVLELDTLDCGDLVFAGTLRVRHGIDVDGTLRTGRGIQAGAGIRAGTALAAGGDVACEAALACDGPVSVRGLLRAGWNIQVRDTLECEELKAGWDLDCTGPVRVRGQARVGQHLHAGAGMHCDKGLRAGGDILCEADLSTRHGVECGALLRCAGHVTAGWGIRARAGLHAAGAIRAGESLWTEGRIVAGEGYGIFAGLNVPAHAWESSARVQARSRPAGLRSGWWAGPAGGPACEPCELACHAD
ncbi:hypothetical protein V8Z80_11030 [Orrella sp. JC864]|uniref:hypothetical protein n=1 Tax=Orrella sp. JC864 TaxID=3120298 RepID=UPI0012BB70EE